MTSHPTIVGVYVDTVYQRYGVRITSLPEWWGHGKWLQKKLGWNLETTLGFVEWAVLAWDSGMEIPSIMDLRRKLRDWYDWRRQTATLSSRLSVLAAVARADRMEPRPKGRNKTCM